MQSRFLDGSYPKGSSNLETWLEDMEKHRQKCRKMFTRGQLVDEGRLSEESLAAIIMLRAPAEYKEILENALRFMKAEEADFCEDLQRAGLPTWNECRRWTMCVLHSMSVGRMLSISISRSCGRRKKIVVLGRKYQQWQRGTVRGKRLALVLVRVSAPVRA